MTCRDVSRFLREELDIYMLMLVACHYGAAKLARFHGSQGNKDGLPLAPV